MVVIDPYDPQQLCILYGQAEALNSHSLYSLSHLQGWMQKWPPGARKMAQWSRALAALLVDLSLIPSTQSVYNSSSGDPLPFSYLQGHQACTCAQTCMEAKCLYI